LPYTFAYLCLEDIAMKTNFISLLFSCLLLIACNSEPTVFIYTFTVESTDAYKLTLTVDHTKKYTILEDYIFFEHKPSNYKSPKLYEGDMNNEEFSKFKQLLGQSKLFKLQDSYGINENSKKSTKDILYHINYLADEKEKSIFIKLDDSQQFPLPFTQLIEYTDTLINKYKEP